MSTFRLKKQGKYLVLQLKPFVTGIRRVKSILLDLHREHDYIINKTYLILSIAILLVKRKKGKSLTVVFPPKNNLMILSDKNIFSDPTILIMSWLQISLQELIGKEKELKPFWNSQCKEISQKLWLPTKTDCVDLDSTFSNGFLRETMSKSLYSTKMSINPQAKILPTTSFPSSTSFPASKWEGDDTQLRTKKIRFYPNKTQQSIFKSWIGTTRYVYNQCLAAILSGEKANWKKLRNRFVTQKNNPHLKEWEFNTPKDVRVGAIQDLCIASKSAFTNLRNGNISQFKLGFRSKRKESSILIPSSAMKLIKDNTKTKRNLKLKMYSTYISSLIKLSNDPCLNGLTEIKHDCRLSNENGKWFLCIPFDKQIDKNYIPPREVIASDPGVKSFHVLYSDNQVIDIEIKKDKQILIHQKLDLMQSLRKQKNIPQRHYKRRRNKINYKLRNQIDDLHFQTISYLTKTYKTIILPKFESQKLVGKMTGDTSKRILMTLRHFVFRQRLISKSNLIENSSVLIETEEYTTKTCGVCGHQEDVGFSREFNCSKCGLCISRDSNGSRNILIKTIAKYL